MTCKHTSQDRLMHGQKQSPAMVVLFPPPPMAPITPWIMNSVCWSVSPPARFSWAPPIIPAIKSLKPPANTPVVQRLPQEVLRLESVPRWPSCSSWTMRRTCWEDSSESIPLLLPAWAGYQIAGLGGRGPGLLCALVRSLEEECI